MEKRVNICIGGEVDVELDKDIDLIELMDDELTDQELRTYTKARLEGTLEASVYTTEELLITLVGRPDFLKELAMLSHKNLLDIDKLVEEINR